MARRKPTPAYRTDASRMPVTSGLPEAESLVGLGFRFWMQGRKSGEIGMWERTWNLYSGHFGLCGARLAVSALSGWVEAVDLTSRREIMLLPTQTRAFCRDECIAVSMIAACQHQTCPAMRACAFALAEATSIERVVCRAQVFADAMDGLEQRLSSHSVALFCETPAGAHATVH